MWDNGLRNPADSVAAHGLRRERLGVVSAWARGERPGAPTAGPPAELRLEYR